MTVAAPSAVDVLAVQEADAWGVYLEATRSLTAGRYADLEPSAWARLERRLAIVRARRAALRHVLDDGVALPDIRTAETVGADWCVWSRGSFAGCRIETTVAVALGVCTSLGDTTISGLDW